MTEGKRGECRVYLLDTYMAHIECIYNYGYTWLTNDDIWFKGYFVVENSLYKGIAAINYLRQSYDDRLFPYILECLNGSFAFIIHTSDSLWAVVDRARSIPLYFSSDGSIVSDSSESIRTMLDIDKGVISKKDLMSLLYTQHTVLNNTVYNRIKQLNLGQYLHISENGTIINYYYRHISKIKEIGIEDLAVKYRNVLDSVFDRLVKAIDGRPVLLSLSGGYDSRLVAVMLKEKGLTDVTCYTYGQTDQSFEVVISKRVATALSFHWYNVKYSDKDIKSLFSEQNFAYFQMANSHDSIPYLQNYLAVKYLHENNLIKDGSVVITGLCGDLPSGSYVRPHDYYTNLQLNYDSIVDERNKTSYFMFKPNRIHLKELTEELVEDLKNCEIKLTDIQSFVSLTDCIAVAGEHSRCFLNANKAHEFFGYEWLLPLWDNEYLQFWYETPMAYRESQRFYESYLMENLWSKYDIAIKKKKSLSASEKNRNRFGAIIRRKIKYDIGLALVRISLVLGIPIRRKTADPNNFGASSALLYNGIKNKSAIQFRRANFKHLFSIYSIEQRYGDFVLKKK